MQRRPLTKKEVQKLKYKFRCVSGRRRTPLEQLRDINESAQAALDELVGIVHPKLMEQLRMPHDRMRRLIKALEKLS